MGRLREECQSLLTIHFFDSKQHSRMRLIKRCWECFQGERHVFRAVDFSFMSSCS